jgi:hypothetical protein
MTYLDVIGTPNRLTPGQDADRMFVHSCIESVRACLAEHRAEDTRRLLAQLVFDFQPLIIQDAGLKAIVISLLDQCRASALQQRLAIATGAVEAQ